MVYRNMWRDTGLASWPLIDVCLQVIILCIRCTVAIFRAVLHFHVQHNSPNLYMKHIIAFIWLP